MTADELIAWRKMMKLSQRAAAEIHGYGTRQWRKFECGIDAIRPCIDLACAAYALGIRFYDGPSIAAQMEEYQKQKGKKK